MIQAEEINKIPILEFLDKSSEMGITPTLKRHEHCKENGGGEYYKLYIGGIEIFFETKKNGGWIYTGWGANLMGEENFNS